MSCLTGICEVCGKTAGLVIIHKQIKGEYVRMNVCKSCSYEYKDGPEYGCLCYRDGKCLGTREIDPCSCEGVPACCDFYPEKRKAEERRKIIAVDFDGTLCENKWPGIGEPNQEIIDYLIDQRNQGAQLILWTCRDGDKLREARRWCSERGLFFDYINENAAQSIIHFGADTRKIYADEYIDDKACTKFELPFKVDNQRKRIKE